jgi:hypothetical protein
LPSYLREDQAYALNSYNWISFGTWEFDVRRRAGYLGDVDYFEREITAEEEENDQEDADEDEDEDKDADEDEDEDEDVNMAHYDHDDGGPAWDPETQPPDISEEEAIAMALANSEQDELNELALWDGLAIQLRESALAQGRPATPPATPTRSNEVAESERGRRREQPERVAKEVQGAATHRHPPPAGWA